MVSSERNEPSLDPTSPEVRVVLLGASNLTRDAGLVLDQLRCKLGSPLDVLLAMGHGRGFRARSCLLGRRLPSIVECGLWRALSERRAASTTALVTDIGNDLMYGVGVDEIVVAVAECLGLLAAVGSRVVMTLPPVHVLPHLSRTRYYLLRNVLYPRCRLGFDCVVDRVRVLNDRLQRLGVGNVRLVEPRRDWYGFDPIHLRRSRRRQAWSEILDEWPPTTRVRRPRLRDPLRWHDMIGLSPERRWLFGIPRYRQQPAKRLRDTTTLSLF